MLLYACPVRNAIKSYDQLGTKARTLQKVRGALDSHSIPLNVSSSFAEKIRVTYMLAKTPMPHALISGNFIAQYGKPSYSWEFRPAILNSR